MSNAKQLRDNLFQELAESRDPDQVGKGIEQLKNLTEMEKLSSESEKLRIEAANLTATRRAEDRRFYISVLSPMVSTFVLAITLLLQIYQAYQKNRDDTAAKEASNFHSALSEAIQRDPVRAYVGATLLMRFLDSKEYGQHARSAGLSMLYMLNDPGGFESIFDQIMEHTKPSQYADVIALDRQMRSLYYHLEDEVDRASQVQNNKNASTPSPPGLTGSIDPSRLSDELDNMGSNIKHLSQGAASLLKNRKTGDPVALNKTLLWDAGLQQVNLQGADLEDAQLMNCNLQEVNLENARLAHAEVTTSDLSRIKSFRGSDWTATIWWRASHIDPDLLQYLKTNYPFTGSANDYSFSGDGSDLNQKTYSERVTALEMESKSVK